MDDKTVDLDTRRGAIAQKATELRRLIREVVEDQEDLRDRRKRLEELMISAPAADWKAVAEKVRYVFSLFHQATEDPDERRPKLMANILADMDRLQAGSPDEPLSVAVPPVDGG